MRLIVKNAINTIVAAYEQELKAAKLDKESLAHGQHAGKRPRDLFEDGVKRLPSYIKLCQHMLMEQGYTCCYCGCRLPHDTIPKFVIEHLVPISHDITGVGEYHNMMIACDGGERSELPAGVKRGKALHCDRSKSEQILSVTPLQPDCERRFIYHNDGTISPVEGDAEAQSTIKILCLSSPLLCSARQQVINSLLYESDGTLLPDSDLRLIASAMQKKDRDGAYLPYSFAVQKVIEELLY